MEPALTPTIRKKFESLHAKALNKYEDALARASSIIFGKKISIHSISVEEIISKAKSLCDIITISSDLEDYQKGTFFINVAVMHELAISKMDVSLWKQRKEQSLLHMKACENAAKAYGKAADGNTSRMKGTKRPIKRNFYLELSSFSWKCKAVICTTLLELPNLTSEENFNLNLQLANAWNFCAAAYLLAAAYNPITNPGVNPPRQPIMNITHAGLAFTAAAVAVTKIARLPTNRLQNVAKDADNAFTNAAGSYRRGAELERNTYK